MTVKYFFTPELLINMGVKDISFYESVFGKVEQIRFSNNDRSIHVAEHSIDGAIFHVHEITAKRYWFSTDKHSVITICIGLFVPDVDGVINRSD